MIDTIYSKRNKDDELYHYGIKGMKWRHHKSIAQKISDTDAYKDAKSLLPLLSKGYHLYKQYKKITKPASKKKKKKTITEKGKNILDRINGKSNRPRFKKRKAGSN